MLRYHENDEFLLCMHTENRGRIYYRILHPYYKSAALAIGFGATDSVPNLGQISNSPSSPRDYHPRDLLESGFDASDARRLRIFCATPTQVQVRQLHKRLEDAIARNK
jgi:hypothetical protein